MFVFLDTNVLLKDINLVSNSFEELRRHSEKLGIKLFVSSIVLDEVVQRYKEKIIDFNQKTKGYSGFVPSRYLQPVPVESIDELAEQFKQELRRKLRINTLGTRFVEWHYLDHDSSLAVYEKAVRKLKPFDYSGKGYKDALIWEHLMWVVNTYCAESRKLAFITDNINDFSDKMMGEGGWYRPSRHLIEQYRRDGLPEDTVRIYQSLKAFTIDVIHHKLENYTAYKERLNTELNDKLKFYIRSQLQDDAIGTGSGGMIVHEIWRAEALDAYNEYGNTEEAAVFKIRFDMSGFAEGSSRASTYSGTAYIAVDLRRNEFLSFEADIL